MEGRNGNTVLITVIGVATLLVALVGATFAYFTATVGNSASQSISIVTATPIALQVNPGTGVSIIDAVPTKTESNSTLAMTVYNPTGSTVNQSYDVILVVDGNTFNTSKVQGDTTADDDNALIDQLELKIKQESNKTSAQNGATLKITDATDGAKTVMTSAQITATKNIGDVSNNPGALGSTRADLAADEVLFNMTNGGAIVAGHTASTNVAGQYQVVNDQQINIGETHTYTMALWFRETGINQNRNADEKSFMAHLVLNDVKALSTSTRVEE